MLGVSTCAICLRYTAPMDMLFAPALVLLAAVIAGAMPLARRLGGGPLAPGVRHEPSFEVEADASIAAYAMVLGSGGFACRDDIKNGPAQ